MKEVCTEFLLIKLSRYSPVLLLRVIGATAYYTTFLGICQHFSTRRGIWEMLEGAERGKKNKERRSAERLSLYAKVALFNFPSVLIFK